MNVKSKIFTTHSRRKDDGSRLVIVSLQFTPIPILRKVEGGRCGRNRTRDLYLGEEGGKIQKIIIIWKVKN